jgi:hypothetical protein
MTTALPSSPGRHRAPEATDQPRWSTPAEFVAAWARIGRHAAPEPSGGHAAADLPDGSDGPDVFDRLGFAPAAS